MENFSQYDLKNLSSQIMVITESELDCILCENYIEENKR